MTRGGAVLLAVLLLALLAGCDATTSSPGASASPGTPGATSGPSGPSRPTVSPSNAVQIADLGAFRQKLADAMGSGKWQQVAPLLSPNFSFQGPESAGARLVMPDSAADFQQIYTSKGPWHQGAQYEVNIHGCYGGKTPSGQQIGFDGSGPFLLMGIEKWQGYWVVVWSFDDPLGGNDACATEG
jgi:hypothetical protein